MVRQGYKDSRGKVWSNDMYYSSNTNVESFFNLQFLEPHPYGIEGTHDQQILLTERSSSSSFYYQFPNIAPGRYLVRLYWAELHNSNFVLFAGYDQPRTLRGVGVRVFSVSINHQPMISNVDVFQSVGPYAQMMREIWVNVASEGYIRLDFGKIVDSPMIHAIEIVREMDVVPQQQLPAGRKQGLVSLFYDYRGYHENPIQTMPDGGEFRRPISLVEISDYYSNPTFFGLFRSSPLVEQFAVKVNAYIRIPVAGRYVFTLESNDGSQMWIWTTENKQRSTPVYINND